jgi:GNAT superfamily N-acetyltransferase
MRNGKFIKLTSTEIRELAQICVEKRGATAQLLANVAALYLNTNLNEYVPTQFFAYDGNFRGEDAFILARQSKLKYFYSETWTLCPPEAKYVQNEMIDAFDAIIDWSIYNCFTSVHTDIANLMRNLIKMHGNLVEYGTNSVFRLSDQQLNTELKIADPNTTVEELDDQGVKQLVKHWEYANQSTYEEICDSSVNIVGSAGLRLNNELVSWAYGATDGAIHGLFTLENHRGRGYGKIVLHALGQMLDKKGLRAITEVEDKNTASKKLMKNSGFDFCYTMWWLEFMPMGHTLASRFKDEEL